MAAGISAIGPSAEGIAVTIEPSSDRFDPDDQRWRDQVAALHAALREEVGAVDRRVTPRPDHKGGVEAVVLALGSSGALTASVACFRAWLARDKSRSLTLTWTDGSGAEQRIEATGDNIDPASFQALAHALGSRLGNG